MRWASDQGQEARPGTGQSTRRRRCGSGGPRSPSEKAARGGLLWWSAQPRGHRPRGQGGERPAPPCLHLPASHGGFPLTERAKATCAVGQGKAARRVGGARAGAGPAGTGSQDAHEAHPLPALSPGVSEQTHGPGHGVRVQQKGLASGRDAANSELQALAFEVCYTDANVLFQTVSGHPGREARAHTRQGRKYSCKETDLGLYS